MARAEAAEPVCREAFALVRDQAPARAAISGHARLLARPAYQRLLAAEPLLRRLIPILIVIFLVIVGLARFVELYQLKTEREYDARETMGMIATVLAGALDRRGEPATPPSTQRRPQRARRRAAAGRDRRRPPHLRHRRRTARSSPPRRAPSTTRTSRSPTSSARRSR